MSRIYTITGRNQYGQRVTETFTDEDLNDPFVRDLGYITREKYASFGIDIDAELNRMVRRKKTIRWYLYYASLPIRRMYYRVLALFGKRDTESLW